MLAAALALALLFGGWALSTPSTSTNATGPQPVVGSAVTQPAPFSAYLQSTLAQQNGDLPRATQTLISALADDPTATPIAHQALAASLMAGDVPTAIRLAQTLSPTSQTFLSALTLSAQAIAQNNPKAALHWLHQSTPESANLPPLRWLAAHLTVALPGTAPSQTVPAMVKALQQQPLPQPLHPARAEHLARLWLSMGAVPSATAVLTTPSPSTLTATQLAIQLLASQNTSSSLAQANQIAQQFAAANPTTALLLPALSATTFTPPTLNENAAVSLRDFALLLWQQQAVGPAEQVFQLALWLEPTSAPLWPSSAYLLALLNESAGNLPEASALYQRAAAAPAATPNLQLAVQLRQLEIAYTQAPTLRARAKLLATAEELTQQHPTLPATFHTLASLAQAQHAYPTAYAAYQHLLTTLPQEAPATLRDHLTFATAAMAERSGDTTTAEKLFLQLLARNPAHAQGLNYLGYLWVTQGKNLTEAHAMLRRALLLAPEDGAIMDSVGWAYFMQGDATTALTYLLKAVELEPEDPTVADHLGDTYAKLSQPDEARLQWQRALTLATAPNVPEPEPGFIQSVRRKLNP